VADDVDQGSSEKQRTLLKSVGEIEGALERIQKASTGDLRPVGVGDGGFFGFLGGGGSDVDDPYKVSGILKQWME